MGTAFGGMGGMGSAGGDEDARPSRIGGLQVFLFFLILSWGLF